MSDEEATKSQPKDIKRVSKETVHKICSSQVILNLAIAVKELVENAVDAGSKIIDIKIKNYGLDGFEVSDNGSGIEERNFEGITAKHCTSKLREFEDLQSIRTFGFRGEALSSLCALSEVSIITRHTSTNHGTKMTFDHEGNIIEKKISARNFGTTVIVTEFFKTLPVRRSEFIKNYRKDFNKMVQLLQEYCLVLTGVKIICSNQAKSGSRTTVLNTNGNTVMDNIISIFGPKQSQELVKIKSATSDETEDGCFTQESLVDLDDPNSIIDIKEKEVDHLNKGKFKLEGFISNIEHTSGRSSKDRQFFYVNSRPVELKPIIKIVNEVYHRYNAKSSPFVYLNLKMDQSYVDINLSKDKRQVAICEDKILMYVVKRSLLNTYGELPSKFKFTSINQSVKSLESYDESEESDDDKILTIPPTSNFSQSLKQWKLTPANPIPSKHLSPLKRKLSPPPLSSGNLNMTKVRKINSYFNREEKEEEIGSENEEQDESFLSQNDIDEKSLNEKENVITISCKTLTQQNTLKFEMIAPVEMKIGDIVNSEELEKMEKDLIEISSEEIKCDDEDCIEIDVPKPQNPFKQILKISLDKIANDAKAEESFQEKLMEKARNRSYRLKFKEKIDPSKNKKAEVELETEIKKETFREMEILGQFNLGFIIAKLESDLFIIDQHATDEKYNFEQLQKSFKIETQKMIAPEKLELTAIQEDVIIENLPIFEMNGFRFKIDKDGEVTKRISLISRPYSKNWEFGKEDIEELIFILQESPMTVVRPSAIRKMLASRACRKSVMIGDPLTNSQMKILIKHMGEIEHPWNCPHGRPTIRFLQNLDFIDDKKF